MKTTNINNAVNSEQTAKNKKRNIILGTAVTVVVVAIIILILLLVGCNSTDTATPDEATVDTISTSDEAMTLATLSDKDQAIVDNGLTVNEDGDIVDKDGKKVEPSEDGKVTIKDASGKEIKVDTDSVKTANTNKTYVETTNAIIQSANNNSSNSGGSNSSNSSSNKSNNSSGNASKNNTSSSNNSSSSNTNKNNNTSSGGSSSGNSSGNNGSSSGGSSSNYTPPKQEETKHTHSWSDLTKQVKVVDQEAYSYEETIYKQVDALICKDCNCRVDTMSDAELYEHIDFHLDNGGKGGYYGTVIDVAVGTETVNVPEKSHYETEVIGRECTSCGKCEYY